MAPFPHVASARDRRGGGTYEICRRADMAHLDRIFEIYQDILPKKMHRIGIVLRQAFFSPTFQQKHLFCMSIVHELKQFLFTNLGGHLLTPSRAFYARGQRV